MLANFSLLFSEIEKSNGFTHFQTTFIFSLFKKRNMGENFKIYNPRFSLTLISKENWNYVYVLLLFTL